MPVASCELRVATGGARCEQTDPPGRDARRQRLTPVLRPEPHPNPLARTPKPPLPQRDPTRHNPCHGRLARAPSLGDNGDAATFGNKERCLPDPLWRRVSSGSKLGGMRRTLSLPSLLLVIGCATTSSTPTGTTRYAALGSRVPVAVYSDPSEVPAHFVTVAMLNFNDPGKYHIRSLDDAIPALQDRAREAGANAIIIDHYAPVKSGLISTGITVQARAVLISTPGQ